MDNQVFFTEFCQERLLMHVLWWEEFRAALPEEFLTQLRASEPCPICLKDQKLQGPLSRAVYSINSAKRLCRHQICDNCYENMAQTKPFKCPICRADWTAYFWGLVIPRKLPTKKNGALRRKRPIQFISQFWIQAPTNLARVPCIVMCAHVCNQKIRPTNYRPNDHNLLEDRLQQFWSESLSGWIEGKCSTSAPWTQLHRNHEADGCARTERLCLHCPR